MEDWYKANFEDISYIHTIVEKYNITHLIINIDSELIKELEKSDNYKNIYNDDDFIIYEVERNSK